MTEKDFDEILANLDRIAQRKKDIKLTKAKAEMEAIEREYTAYFDGAYDALKKVRLALTKQEG